MLTSGSFNPKDPFIRYRKKKDHRMTLIIGFKCHEGIALVSDTMVWNNETMESSYRKKILTPLENTPFIVGAAGFSDLFYEFNRKIDEKVRERVRENKIRNVEMLMRTGLTRQQSIDLVQPREAKATEEQQSVEEQRKETTQTESNDNEVELTYFYTAENFMDDCKSLLSTVSSKVPHPNPIEVLIGLRSHPNDFPMLYHLNSNGFEQQINDFYAIGSGSPHVRVFFSRLYDYKKTINELVKDAFRTIVYVQDIAKENTVGFSKDFPPEAVVIANVLGYNIYGKVTYTNIDEVLQTIKEEMKDFDKIIITSKAPVPKEPEENLPPLEESRERN